MKPQGILTADLFFADAHIHFGQKDGQDFSQLSFPVLGDLNNDCEQTTITDTSVDIVFDLNGFPCNIHLEKTDEGWQGAVDISTISLHKDFTCQHLSAEPDFQPHHYAVPEGNLQRLREHANYDDSPCESLMTYELHNPQVLTFLQEQGVAVENRHDFATMRDLMRSICQKIHQDGVYYCHDREHRGTIAQFTHAQQQKGYTNCRGVAIILCGALRAYGFRANVVECWPAPSENSDIHVVCEAWCEELHKHILLDPTSNLIYFLHGVPLSAIELRRALANGQAAEITINEDAAHNGDAVSPIEMLAYMSKNLFLLVKAQHSNESEELCGGNTVVLAPRDLLQDDYPQPELRTCNVQAFYGCKA